MVTITLRAWWRDPPPGHGSIRRSIRDRAERTSDEEREWRMAAMKPRTGDGPLEVTKEGRGIVMRVPLEGGGRLVVEMSATEASELGDALKSVAG
jgi:Protein of unknown function (DUF3117)